MAQELLSVQGARAFVSYALAHDLQIQLNRREACRLLIASLATETDDQVGGTMLWGAESFDKMHTFLLQNDQQVHYHGATTVGVYAVVRLLGELRRSLRDLSADTSPASPLGGLASPSRVRVAPASPVPRVRRELFERIQRAEDTGRADSGVDLASAP